jgi:Flp pilus assembly pilin Flp
LRDNAAVTKQRSRIQRCMPAPSQLSRIESSEEADLKRVFLYFFSDQSGLAAMECWLIAAAIAIAIFAVINEFGTRADAQFTSSNRCEMAGSCG